MAAGGESGEEGEAGDVSFLHLFPSLSLIVINVTEFQMNFGVNYAVNISVSVFRLVPSRGLITAIPLITTLQGQGHHISLA